MELQATTPTNHATTADKAMIRDNTREVATNGGKPNDAIESNTTRREGPPMSTGSPNYANSKNTQKKTFTTSSGKRVISHNFEHDLHIEDNPSQATRTNSHNPNHSNISTNHLKKWSENHSVAGNSHQSAASSLVSKEIEALFQPNKSKSLRNDKRNKLEELENDAEEDRYNTEEEEEVFSIHSDSAYELNLRRKHNQASKYLKKRKFDKAVELFSDIVSLHENQLGEWHPRYAAALHNLAIAQLQSGDLKSSIDSIEDALEKRRLSLGEESPKVVETLVQMGIILSAREEYDDALEVLAEALELKEDLSRMQYQGVKGTNRVMSMEVAKILNNVGCVHYEGSIINTPRNEYHHDVDVDSLEEAELAFTEALEIQETLLEEQEFIGPEFLCMASTMCNLAYIYMDLGCQNHKNSKDTDNDESAMVDSLSVSEKRRYLQDAISKFEDALTIQQGLLEEGHSLILNSLDNIAYCHYRLKQYDDAVKYYKRLLKAQKLALGSDHVDVSDTLIKISKVYLKLCQFEKSYKILDAVTKFYDKYLGKEDRRSMRSRALANSVEHHLTPVSESSSILACASTSSSSSQYLPKQNWTYSSSSATLKDAMIISLRRHNVRNPFTNQRLEFGELSSQFQIAQWDIKKPVNVSKMSGQRISFA